jgi:two-component sensor histidine kinase
MKGDLLARKPEITPTDVELLVNSIGLQIMAVSDLNHILSRTPDGEQVDLTVVIEQICVSLSAITRDSCRIFRSLEPGSFVATGHVLDMSQALSEVLTNAIKHGHFDSEPAEIRVSCRRVTNGDLEVWVSDDGPGKPKEFDHGRGTDLGTNLIDALLRSVGGRMSVVPSHHGTTVRLDLPGAVHATIAKVHRL